MNIVDIIIDNEISPMFIRANDFLLDKHANKFLGLSYKEKIQLLEEYWKLEFKAELIKEKEFYNKIKFADTKTMTMFQLKWS